MIPGWLHLLSILSLALGALCALAIALHVAASPQQMGVMNLVWPIAGLYSGPLALWAYFRYGRLATRARTRQAQAQGREPPGRRETPFAMMVAKSAWHCGGGCTLGDICAEWLAYALPGLLVVFGWHHLFEQRIFAVWQLDFVAAFAFGIAFQYFAIVPMRHLDFGAGLRAAFKADALSLAAWQVGMYGYMAFAHFYLFDHVLGTRLDVATPEFWFMMQIAMLCGLLTAYPVNAWLIRMGWKERM
jgi:Domain of unknown function (DUF4396)